MKALIRLLSDTDGHHEVNTSQKIQKARLVSDVTTFRDPESILILGDEGRVLSTGDKYNLF